MSAEPSFSTDYEAAAVSKLEDRNQVNITTQNPDQPQQEPRSK